MTTIREAREAPSIDHAAIGRLLDKSLPLFLRKAAAERLHDYPSQLACDILYSVVLDPRDNDLVREEAASVLGMLWAEMGVDYPRLRRLPERFRQIAAIGIGD